MKKTISLLLVLSLGLANVSIAEDTWTTKANMPTSRLGLSTSAVDGKIYAIGGGNNIDGSAFRTVEMYDPVTDTWIKKADMSIQRYFHSASVMNGKVYIIGGATGVMVTTPNVDIYDPTTDTWMRKANMPTTRCFLSSCVVNGKIYAIGGRLFPGDISVSTVEEYNPVTDTWTRKADMPTARCFLSTSMVNGKIYAIGGVSGSLFGRGISAVEEYDPVTDIWTKKADMPTARSSLSSSVVNGKIYAVGGGISGSGPVSSAVEEYDPITDSWTTKVDMPTARGLHSASVVDGKIYAIGGAVQLPPHNSISTVEEFDTGLGSPSPDFNGDGIVDAADMCIMVDHWLTDDALCDIAPPPFGDGIVDVQDLILLSEHLFEKILPPELVAYWKLDETEGGIAYELVGGKDGYLLGDPVWQPDSGQLAGALEFDGFDDYVETDFVLDPADGAFSVFAWIQGGKPGQVIISQIDGNSAGETWLGTDTMSGNLMTGLVPQKIGWVTPQTLVSESVITNIQWHHVGFVWDGSYRALYVDGIEVAKDKNAQNPLKPADGGLYIGASKDLDSISFFSGLIDDVRIYNVALTEEEIEALVQYVN
jgi:N-acetylneuraminic acid mutarotase